MDNLYLGNQSNASDINQLNHSKDTITHILNIQQNGKTPLVILVSLRTKWSHSKTFLQNGL